MDDYIAFVLASQIGPCWAYQLLFAMIRFTRIQTELYGSMQGAHQAHFTNASERQ